MAIIKQPDSKFTVQLTGEDLKKYLAARFQPKATTKQSFKNFMINSLNKSEKSASNYCIVFRQAKLANLDIDAIDPRIIAKLMSDWLKTEEGIKADKVGNYMYSCSLKLYEKFLISKGL